MRKTSIGILTIAAILTLAATANATVLFSDNFDAAGSLGSYNIYNGSPAVEDGALSLPYVSTLTTKRNFTDETIIASGGFIVEFDVLNGSSGSFGLGKNQSNAMGEFGLGWRADSDGLYFMNAGYGQDRLVTTEIGKHYFRVVAHTTSFAAGAPFSVEVTVDGTPIDLSSENGFQSQLALSWWDSGQNYLVFSTYSENRNALIDNFRVETAPVPEPATMLLLGPGLVGLAAFRRRLKMN